MKLIITLDNRPKKAVRVEADRACLEQHDDRDGGAVQRPRSTTLIDDGGGNREVLYSCEVRPDTDPLEPRKPSTGDGYRQVEGHIRPGLREDGRGSRIELLMEDGRVDRIMATGRNLPLARLLAGYGPEPV